jgi:phage N-6-adenine-methyltransferase
MSTDLVHVVPGTDLVPDGWCESTVMPWADEQENEGPLEQATAKLAGLIAAYKTLNADALELIKARRYIEVRWGQLLGPPVEGRPEKTSLASEVSPLTPNERYQFRALAEEPAVVEAIVSAEDESEVSRAALLRVASGTKLDVHFSSASDDWSTPEDLFLILDEEFGFTLDVCASGDNAKVPNYYDREQNGLAQTWTGSCWMNPPYGGEIGAWIEKAHNSAVAGTTVVCLVPARTDTGWWWNHVRYGEVRFMRGRLKFGGAETSAPFPNAVVVFGVEACVKWWEWR